VWGPASLVQKLLAAGQPTTLGMQATSTRCRDCTGSSVV